MTENISNPKWTEIGSLADLSDIKQGQILALNVEEETGIKHTIALIRYSDKEWYAMDNLCTHDNGPLEDGIVNSGSCSIECERHGARFDLKTGSVLRMPATEPVKTYPLKIENGVLFIQL